MPNPQAAEILREAAAALRDESRVVLKPEHLYEDAGGAELYPHLVFEDPNIPCRACVSGHLMVAALKRGWAVADADDLAVRKAVRRVIDGFSWSGMPAAEAADRLEALAAEV